MKTILMIVLAVLLGCGKQGSDKLHKIEKTSLSQYVNQKSMPTDPNMTLDKSIVNDSYQFQIALYNDGRFFYDLPKLQNGHGTWKYSNGIIELKAKTSFFDMFIEVKANDKNANTLSIQFTDRFGPNTLKMENVNI